MFSSLLMGIGIAAFAFGIYYALYHNSFKVEPGKRERLVLQNVLSGAMEVLAEGTHFRPPWWVKLADVDLNREAVSSVPEEEVKTSDGAIMLISYRYDIITGRDFDKVTGQLRNPHNGAVHNDADDQTMVSEEAVKLAVTAIDFEKREPRVRDIVEGVVESECGQLKLAQLTSPSEEPGDGVSFPALLIEGQPIASCPAVKVKTYAALCHALASRIEALANKKLTFVGINITSVAIKNLRPKSDATQDSIEKPLRSKKERDAADKMRAGREADLTYREALVAEDPTAFAEVAKAQATREASANFSDAIKDGSNAIGEGLKKFGKG